MAHILFSCDTITYKKIKIIFDELKQDKEAGIFYPDAKKWKDIFGEESLRYFWSPSEKERLEYSKQWFNTPVELRNSDPALKRPWHFESMLDAIKQGDYDLLSCEMLEQNNGRLVFEPQAYPYGGSEALQELIRSCGGSNISVLE